MNMKILLASASIATALAAAPAKADVTWLVNGTFDDGGTVSGQFTLDVYGYLEDNYDLVTTAGSTLPGFTYNASDSYYSNGAFYVDAQPGYHADLHLTFADSLLVGSPTNPLVGGSPGSSWECSGSYSCYLPAGGPTRYITTGFASAVSAAGGLADPVPEPSTWAMILLGFAGLGYATFRRGGKPRRGGATL